jgi:hypothetical protein
LTASLLTTLKSEYNLKKRRLSGPEEACGTTLARFGSNSCITLKPKEIDMANRQQRGTREAKKPKKEKIKVIVAAPSQKASAWQPTLASGKKK